MSPSGSDAPGRGAEATEAPGVPYRFQATTRSPQAPDPEVDDFARGCPRRDAALERAARYLAGRELDAGKSLDAEDVTLVLRAEGAPYVWPHVWTLTGSVAQGEAVERFRGWLAEQSKAGEVRCGNALVGAKGHNQVAVSVAVDALADLDPFPASASEGAWLDLHAHLLVPASEAEVIVLAPRGKPHAIVSSLDRGAVKARFRVDRAGPWLVQVLATVEGGPRPVAEARVLVGAEPTTLASASPAPGESAQSNLEPREALVAMVNAARASEGLRELRRDERLDRIAGAHAEVMRSERRLAHVASDGAVTDRVLGAGIRARAVGENVAHAADARHAHRSLWQSPSHRGNLLEPTFDSLGIGVASDADGTLWVCEVFASGK